jgi:hypothetical protein
LGRDFVCSPVDPVLIRQNKLRDEINKINFALPGRAEMSGVMHLIWVILILHHPFFRVLYDYRLRN